MQTRLSNRRNIALFVGGDTGIAQAKELRKEDSRFKYARIFQVIQLHPDANSWIGRMFDRHTGKELREDT